jgi:hypothetical protein
MRTAPSLPPALAAVQQQLVQMKAQIAQLERNQRFAQLGNSSIDSGALLINNNAGQLQFQLGLQPDGTSAIVSVSQRNPEQPSDPQVASGIAGLYVVWDGAMATGTPPLSDFAAVQVHCSPQQGFIPDATTLQGVITGPALFGVGNLLPGTAYYVALVTITIAGVPSIPSNQISGIPQSVPDNIPAGSITGNKVATGTITGNNIAGGSITAANIRAGTITANEIAASTIVAANLVAGLVKAGIVDGTTIMGASIVGTGTAGEFLAYNGPPQAGNLVLSVSAAAGADPYGNVFLHGLLTYTTNAPYVAQGWQDGTAVFATAPGQGGPYTIASGTLRAVGRLASGWGIGKDNNGTDCPPAVTQIDSRTIAMTGRLTTPASGQVNGYSFASIGSPFLLPPNGGFIPEFSTSNVVGGQNGSVLLRPDGNMQLSGGFFGASNIIMCGTFRW